MPPDFKPPKRIKDPALLRQMHTRTLVCVLCGSSPASIEHVYARGQQGDDVPENLVTLCGDGVSGHHGLMEAEEVSTRIALGEYILSYRPDIIAYMQGKLGEEEGLEWLRQRLFMYV